MGGGRDNTVSENIFASCSGGVYLDARGLWGIAAPGAQANQGYFNKLKGLNISQPPFSTHYPALANLVEDEPGAPKNNVVDRNVFVNCPLPNIHPQAKNGIAITKSVVVGNAEKALVDEATVNKIPDLFSILVRSDVTQSGTIK